jgi:hypothetical protein
MNENEYGLTHCMREIAVETFNMKKSANRIQRLTRRLNAILLPGGVTPQEKERYDEILASDEWRKYLPEGHSKKIYVNRTNN